MTATRVTDYMRFQGLTPQYQALLAEQLRVQRQVSSGRRILLPEDDPVGAARAQMLHQERAGLEQDGRNINEAMSWTLATSSVITQAINSNQRALELAISAVDGSKTDDDRQAMVQEVNQLLEHLVDLGREAHRGHYLLSGTQTDQPAFEADRDDTGIVAVDYLGNEEYRSTEIADGRAAAYNVLGSNEFGGGYGVFRDEDADVDDFDTLINFRDALLSGDTDIIANDTIAELTAAIDHMTLGQSILGGIQNRLLNARTMGEDHSADVSESLSKLEEVDVAEAATRLSSLNMSYQAALASGARIMQTSLLDFVR